MDGCCGYHVEARAENNGRRSNNHWVGGGLDKIVGNSLAGGYSEVRVRGVGYYLLLTLINCHETQEPSVINHYYYVPIFIFIRK